MCYLYCYLISVPSCVRTQQISSLRHSSSASNPPHSSAFLSASSLSTTAFLSSKRVLFLAPRTLSTLSLSASPISAQFPILESVCNPSWISCSLVEREGTHAVGADDGRS